MPLFELKSYQFRKEREEGWRELEGLLKRVERSGLRVLNADEIVRLPTLYRAAISALSVARAISLDRNLLEYLENLCARAYFTVYGPKERLTTAAGAFVAGKFPRAVRAFRWHLLVATLVFMIAAYVGCAYTRADPENYFSFVNEEMAQGRTPFAERDYLKGMLFKDELTTYDEHEEGSLAEFSAFLFLNNSTVGIFAFAIGAVPLVLVSYVLWQNGVILGAMSEVHHGKDLALEWYSWLLPHGVTELLAIMLCAAAGLGVGFALLFPGSHTRARSVILAGREAGTLVLGSLGLFLVAGLIEGIFRQMVQDMTVRYSLAAGTALVWILYFSFAGRRRNA